MTFLLPVNAYVYENHRKYPTAFGKLRKCLKTASYAFLDFSKFSKNLSKFSEKFRSFLKLCLSYFTSFENFLKNS